jgi:hypothetical protein
MKTREEHLAWAKARALEYVERGEWADALGNMISDLKNHPELENHVGIQLGAILMLGGHLSSPGEVKNFIEGFN